MKIFNLFKRVKEFEYQEELYYEIFEIDGHFVEVQELRNGVFRYEVYQNNSDEKLLIVGYTEDTGTAYSEANSFIERIADIEPIILEIFFCGCSWTYIINEYSAGVILEDYKEDNIKSIDFYDYKLDRHIALPKDRISGFTLDGYYE